MRAHDLLLMCVCVHFFLHVYLIVWQHPPLNMERKGLVCSVSPSCSGGI